MFDDLPQDMRKEIFSYLMQKDQGWIEKYKKKFPLQNSLRKENRVLFLQNNRNMSIVIDYIKKNYRVPTFYFANHTKTRMTEFTFTLQLYNALKDQIGSDFLLVGQVSVCMQICGFLPKWIYYVYLYIDSNESIRHKFLIWYKKMEENHDNRKNHRLINHVLFYAQMVKMRNVFLPLFTMETINVLIDRLKMAKGLDYHQIQDLRSLKIAFLYNLHTSQN